jgi:hypothetical protein
MERLIELAASFGHGGGEGCDLSAHVPILGGRHDDPPASGRQGENFRSREVAW